MLTKITISPMEETINIDDRCLSLTQLASKITENSSHSALCEILSNRTIFSLKDRNKDILLTEFLCTLKRTKRAKELTGGSDEALSNAYDLALDRFLNLPSPNSSDRTDCRYYYAAFLKECNHYGCSGNGVEDDFYSELLFQKFVKKHFWLCCLEAKRRHCQLRKRYRWQKGEKTFTFWVPSHIPGSVIRKWLESSISSDAWQYPLAKDEIQEKLDAYFGINKFVSIDDHSPASSSCHEENNDGFSYSLSRTVAEEKEDNCDKLRPAIRRLGPKNIRKMVIDIFSSITSAKTNYSKIADKFGLTAATFSRWAGVRWQGNGQKIPDLWKNTAEVLANNSEFMDAVQKTGLIDRITTIMSKKQ